MENRIVDYATLTWLILVSSSHVETEGQLFMGFDNDCFYVFYWQLDTAESLGQHLVNVPRDAIHLY